MRMRSNSDKDVYDVSRLLHKAYLEHAEEVGWEVQEETDVDFSELPEENQEVMERTARDLIKNFKVYRK